MILPEAAVPLSFWRRMGLAEIDMVTELWFRYASGCAELRYHGDTTKGAVMAMTLRLDPAHEELLTQLAEQQQRSKSEIIALAIEDLAARTAKRDRTRAAFARVLERDADLLDALSK